MNRLFHQLETLALVFDPLLFVHRQLTREQSKHVFYKTVFITINIAIFMWALAAAVIAALIIPQGTLPAWYVLLTPMIPAITGFLGALLNFFVIKDKIVQTEKNISSIKGEIILYNLKHPKYNNVESKEFELFANVAKRINYKKELDA